MGNRPEITAVLSLSIQRHIDERSDPRIYWAREVTFDYATGKAVRVDYMQFKPVNNTVSGIEKGDFYCYEVKSSVEDFRSKNGHNFLGDYNYYVMPEDVYEKIKNEIPYGVGVYVPDRKHYRGEWYILRSVKKAARKDRAKPQREWIEDIVDQCREWGTPVFMKSSLEEIWGEPLIQEFPERLKRKE